MQKSRVIALISGIFLALIAVFMVRVYLEQQRQIMEEEKKEELAQIQAGQTAVLVAKQDLPKGAVIEAKMLETAIVPNKEVQLQVATSLDRIAGMTVATPIAKGEQITLNKLGFSAGEVAAPGAAPSLAMATPVGKRAITISVDNIAALLGMIRPGDHVDVIALVKIPRIPEEKQEGEAKVIPLFQNVLVLAVGQETHIPSLLAYKKEEKKPEASSMITLALTPQEASLIAFVQEQGRIRLVLRSPADSQIQPVPPASWQTLLQYTMPEGKTKPELEKEETGYVEIYRGLERERAPLVK